MQTQEGEKDTSKGKERGAPTTFIMFEDPCEAAMAVHLLMLAVVYYTHVGEAAEVSPRLSHLHALLDSEVLEKFPEGYVEVNVLSRLVCSALLWLIALGRFHYPIARRYLCK